MLIIVSGSAGVGKSTVITEILKRNSKIKLMQTCTTRAKRKTDVKMQNPYIYVSREEFENKIKNGELFEHEEIHQNFYGVLNKSLAEIEKREFHFMKDIGVLGQINLARALKDKCVVLGIFLTAPKDVLIKRLKERGDHDIDLRISRMEFELSYSHNYDAIIENLNLEKTVKKIEGLIKKYEKKEQKMYNQ